MTSWSATNPGRRTLWTATPPSSPPRVPARVSFSAFLCVNGLSLRRAARRRAVERAVPEGASSLAAWCISITSTASKCGAAMSARCIINTAPIAKFGATIPPTCLALHAVSSLSTSALDSPVVPTTGAAPAATAAAFKGSRLVPAAAGAPSAPVPAAPTPSANPPLPRCGRRRGERDRHGFLADLLLDRQTLRGQLFDCGLTAQVEAALAVDLDR